MFLSRGVFSLSLRNKFIRRFSVSSEDKEILITAPTPYFTKLMINRPASLNALTYTMARTIHEMTAIWNKSQTKAVWFCGKGKAFCAGGDVKALYDVNLTKDPVQMKIHDTFFREEFTCDYKIKTMKPTQISIYDGFVMGGGVGLSIHSKVKIATESTIFAMPEAKIGFFTDVSGSYFLSRLPNNLGIFLGLTGMRLKGIENVQCGISNFFVRKENLEKLEKELVESVTAESTEESILSIVKKYHEKNTEEYHYAKEVKELFSGDTLKEVYDNLQKDTKYADFSKKMLKTMQGFSPSSLRIIFEAIKRGKTMSLEEVFKMEFRLTQRFMQDNDFFEGVRCTLVDKKDLPKWKYRTPFEMSEAEVLHYFSPLPKELELNLELK